MTHKQWFNNVLHLHPVHEEGARLSLTALLNFKTPGEGMRSGKIPDPTSHLCYPIPAIKFICYARFFLSVQLTARYSFGKRQQKTELS